MKEYTTTAPSKINIGLNIISKREDGFHDLETIFYPVKLHDTLFLQESGTFSFTCNNIQLNNENSNTILKAKEVLENITGKEIQAKVILDKRIPIGSGMGGGSSDGAAALKAFNEFFSLGLKIEELEKAALLIGSDVPFFVNPEPKFASSKGEVFKSIKMNLNLPLLIINPGIHISTAWAFNQVKPCKPSFSLTDINVLDNDSLKKYRTCIQNDFEEVVFNKYPEIGEIKETMYRYGAVFSLMTGTGSTVFAFFNNNLNASKAEMSVKGKYFTYLEAI